MKFLGRTWASGRFGVITITILALVILFTPTVFTGSAGAAGPRPKGPHSKTQLRKGPPMLPFGKSKPLHPVINPPKPVTILPHSAIKAALPAGCTAINIDLKVLIIATDGTEADLPAITQTLDYLGTPYTLYLAAKTPNGLTPDKLSNGCHGFYQGVILTIGDLGYFNGTAWISALSQQEWTNLWTYQATMGVRLLSWYTYPNANYGYQPPSGAIDTSSHPLAIQLTAQGKTTFSYLNPTAMITIQYAYTYQAKPLTDGATTSLLTDASGNTLVAMHAYPDGRQALSLTFDSNPNLLHSVMLSYGLVNWLTKGLFLGERHTYMSAQIDDLFIDDSEWLPTTPCGTPVDNTGATYRITGNDLQTVLNWQASKQATSVGANLTLTMAFNGFGTEPGAYTPDTLTPFASNNEDQLNWVSHTYDHTNLDSVSYDTAVAEITQNVQAASDPLGLTHFSPLNMVTPDVSGLTNANFLKAAYDNGIRYLVTDTSRAGYNNPSPNAGIYNSLQPQILMIPRRPNNLFYNVSTPNEWVAEYNCIYQSFWGRSLSYQEILDIESQTLVTYMLEGDLDPWMFHQPNLRAYDGQHTLLGDLLDLMMKKYAQYYNLVVTSPTMDALGQTVANRMQYNSAGVTASIVPGVSITITAQKAARVPVTGLNTIGAENYGGQFISYINVAAGQSVTLPLK